MSQKERVVSNHDTHASRIEVHKTGLPILLNDSLEKLCPREKAMKLSTIFDMNPELFISDGEIRLKMDGPIRIPITK